jgi:hypothetical protein
VLSLQVGGLGADQRTVGVDVTELVIDAHLLSSLKVLGNSRFGG